MDYYSSLDSRSLDSTPTIFEIISSNELEQLLSPSLRYIIVNYAQKYPSLFLKLAMNFDELNLVIRGLIEHHYLKSWNSSFTENFYGLKRQTKNNVNIMDTNHKIFDIVEKKKRLSQLQIYGSLVNLVGGAYINEKLEVFYQQLHSKILLKSLKPTTLTNKLKYYYVKTYPYIISAIKLLNVIFQILYLSGRTKSPSFIDFILKIEYSRLSKFDYDLHDKASQHTAATSSSSSLSSPQKSTKTRPPSFAQHLSRISQVYQRPLRSLMLKLSTTIFPMAIFLLKFLEWWNSSEYATKFTKNQQNIIDKEIPPPPPSTSPNHKTSKKITNFSNCPICEEKIQNAAVIETGHVFCYTCIMKFLIDGDETLGGRCPITGQKLVGCTYSAGIKQWRVENIRRLII